MWLQMWSPLCGMGSFFSKLWWSTTLNSNIWYYYVLFEHHINHRISKTYLNGGFKQGSKCLCVSPCPQVNWCHKNLNCQLHKIMTLEKLCWQVSSLKAHPHRTCHTNHCQPVPTRNFWILVHIHFQAAQGSRCQHIMFHSYLCRWLQKPWNI